METFLVTGALGFVGSHLCHRLLAEGKRVYGFDVVDRPIRKKLQEHPGFTFVHDSIRNYALLERLVAKSDCVCHLAAVAEPLEYVERPHRVMDVDLRAALELVDMTRLSGALFFFTSTSEIYGRNPAVPWKEDADRVLGSTKVRRWCYSSSKSAVEHYIQACHHSGQLDFVITRLFNVYGPGLRGRVVNAFLDRFLAGEPITVHGDGAQTRTFTYIDDAIDAFIRLIADPKAHNDIYNVGNEVETSVLQLAETMKATGEFASEIVFEPHEVTLGKSYEDIPRRVPDVTRIRETIGWESTTSLPDGIIKLIEAARREQDPSHDPEPGILY